MRAGKDGPGWGPYGCMAGPGFKHDVLRIVSSDFDEGQEEPSLGVILEASDSPMFIVIFSAKPSC